MGDGVAVLVPVRREGAGILDSLPAAWRAACTASATLNLLVAVDAPGALAAARSFAGRHEAVRVHALATAGKWPALRHGAGVTDEPVLVLMDAGVRPDPDAIALVAGPVLGGRAEACGCRIDCPPSLAGATPEAALINHWEQRNCDAWHRVRSTGPQASWCVAGGLYALRRELFPAEVLVPGLDDASVGAHLLESGARVAYEPASRIGLASSPDYRQWFRRKLRHRRAWLALGTHRPALVASMRSMLLGALDQVCDPWDWRDQLLRAHHRSFWRLAAVAEAVRPTTADSW